MFLLVPAYPGCPGSKAVKRSLLLSLRARSAFQTITVRPREARTSIFLRSWSGAITPIPCLHLYYAAAPRGTLRDSAIRPTDCASLGYRPFSSPFSGTTYKGKTNLDYTEARDSEWQWHQLGHMQVCTSLQTYNHARTPPLSFLQAGCPSCRPTNSVKALRANVTNVTKGENRIKYETTL